MIWVQAVGSAVCLAVTVLALQRYRQLGQQLRQARLLQEQMEADHAVLVRNVIETNNRLVREPKTGLKRGPWE